MLQICYHTYQEKSSYKSNHHLLSLFYCRPKFTSTGCLQCTPTSFGGLGPSIQKYRMWVRSKLHTPISGLLRAYEPRVLSCCSVTTHTATDLRRLAILPKYFQKKQSFLVKNFYTECKLISQIKMQHYSTKKYIVILTTVLLQHNSHATNKAIWTTN